MGALYQETTLNGKSQNIVTDSMFNHDIPDWLPLRYFDIDNIPYLPSHWYAQIHDIVNQFARHTILTGDNETSFEKNARIPVDVLDGEHIKQHMSWLFKLYNNEFLDFVRTSFGHDVYVSNDDTTAININKLSGVGARYEWHVDTNSVTGLLFVDDIPVQSGGALVFKKGGDEYSIQPKRGRFYCFLTENLPHAVEPITVNHLSRLSIPMNYYFDQYNRGRDPSVHRYLTRSM